MTPQHFAWQAWRLVTSTFVLGGRRGAWPHASSFCVAGVALGHIHPFAWQAWHLWHWAGSGGALRPVLVAGDAAALCVAGVALGDIHLHFAWQAWCLVTSTFVLRGSLWRLVISIFVLRGRCGTYGTGLALVARLGP